MTSSKKKRGIFYRRDNFDFEKTIEKALECVEVKVGRLFIDKIDKKPYLRKVTIRTECGAHFRMVVGKQELIKGFQMFCILIKARYVAAIKANKKGVKK